MSQWKEEELAAIAKDSSLYISIPNADGSMHSPTRIWAAQAGDDLYCRGYAGTSPLKEKERDIFLLAE
ncbi:hypothetical protein GCM10025886_11470 [Tetragenococcus halophilus subsp. flandriensis]|nr:DUF2255 family protein [Tetragenococcus halophilus]GMA07996.1 hypothetical protein GCM10025886_11470 [Tetragenococcus halophilus subsp. flandriensis]